MTRISEALSTEIHRRKKPLITSFEIERLVYDLYQSGVYEGKSLLLRSPFPNRRTVGILKNFLIDRYNRYSSGYEMIDQEELEKIAEDFERSTKFVLVSDRNFPSSVWRVARVPDGRPDELVCLVDPWCFVSHLSAMQQWSLSNRNPVALHLTRPKASLWRGRAKAEVQAIYANFDLGENFPPPRERVTFPQFVRRRKLSVFEPGYFGHSVRIPDSDVRIATVGQTFRDMLHEPALCGGMAHVLEVWERHAEIYLDDIIQTLVDPDSHTTKIAFVRAGYILTERLGIDDPRVNSWTTYAERGGSRKLDPERPFESTFSEKWMLSLNV